MAVATRSQALQVPGLKAEYFDDHGLRTLVTTRVDSRVNFEWEYGRPEGTALSDGEYFSVRWTGILTAPVTGTYTFTTSTDDGVRLWVAGQSIIDNWTYQDDYDPLSQGTVSLVGGQTYALVMEYFEGEGLAHAQFFWEYPGQERQLVPASALTHDDGPSAPGVPPVSGKLSPRLTCRADDALGARAGRTRCRTRMHSRRRW